MTLTNSPFDGLLPRAGNQIVNEYVTLEQTMVTGNYQLLRKVLVEVFLDPTPFL